MLVRDDLGVLFQSILNQNGPSLFGHAVGGSGIIGPSFRLNEGSSYLPNDAGNVTWQLKIKYYKNIKCYTLWEDKMHWMAKGSIKVIHGIDL